MEAVLDIPQRPTRHFLPQNFKITDWEALAPYYTDLENRSLNSQIIHILEKALEERKKKEAKK